MSSQATPSERIGRGENQGVAPSLLTKIEAIEDIFSNRLLLFSGAVGGKRS